jgi:hypothetical protein
MSELTGHLGLENHSDADALAVQYTGRQHGFNRVSDCVSKVDEVAKPSRLAFVIRDYVRLDRDRAHDDGEEQLLGSRACRLGTPRIVDAGGLNSGNDVCRSRLERGKVGLVPDGGGL